MSEKRPQELFKDRQFVTMISPLLRDYFLEGISVAVAMFAEVPLDRKQDEDVLVFISGMGEKRFMDKLDKQLKTKDRKKDCTCINPGEDDGFFTCWRHHNCAWGDCTHNE